MLLVWHGYWRGHVYVEDITEVLPQKEREDEDWFFSVTIPPIYEIESIKIDERIINGSSKRNNL